MTLKTPSTVVRIVTSATFVDPLKCIAKIYELPIVTLKELLMRRFCEIDGHMYLVVEYEKPKAKCYKCALYNTCGHVGTEACDAFSGNCYFVEVPRKIRDVNIEEIDFTKSRVKYKGITQDKCGVKGLIHDTELALGNNVWPIYTDIYWFDTPYWQLREKLLRNVQTLWMIREQTNPRRDDVESIPL